MIQIISGVLICAVLYSKTPAHSVRGEIADLVVNLGGCTRKEGGILIDEFIDRTGMQIAIYKDPDDYGKTFNIFDNELLVKDIGTKTLKSSKEVFLAYESTKNDTFGFGNSGFSFKNEDTIYVMSYFDNGKTINTLEDSIKESVPAMAAVVISLSLINSLIFTFLFARPVKQLSKYSGAMAELDFQTRCPDKRNDEIGDLARDLNKMSATLDQKIKQLEEEIVRVHELESQKETFFAAASHELKTPVTILEGNIRGMIEGVEPYNDHDEYLSRSLRTVKRMESLINEILTASKMQSASDISFEPVDMTILAEEKTDELDDLFAIRNIEVEKNLPGNAYISGNKDLTSLALGAFISNAVFYSSEGSKITLSVTEKSGMVITEVRNSNAHIDDSDIPHLFEPFYRSDASRSRNSGGSGLGLYIAKLIITKQGGSCTLSNDGDDVSAVISLPSTQNP